MVILMAPQPLFALKTPEASEGSGLRQLAGLLEGPWVEGIEVLAVDPELEAQHPALYAAARSAGKTHVVLTPDLPTSLATDRLTRFLAQSDRLANLMFDLTEERIYRVSFHEKRYLALLSSSDA